MTKIRLTLATATLAALAACGGTDAPRPVDDALRNDLALAAQVRAPMPPQYVGPAELGQYPPLPPGYAPQYPPQYAPQHYAPQYAPQPVYQPVYAAPAPAPRPAATVRRTSSAGSSGSRASSGTIYREPAPQQTRVVKHTKRDAAIGAVAGAAIGVATASKKDRLKGGLLGAVAGAVVGGVIGNNVDVKRVPVPQY